ncbi:MAG: MscS family membrane protein [Pseudohongiellaceae bacterium]|jgi:MscS family membrane protein
MMENWFGIESLRELGWGIEVFAAVALTLTGRYVANRFLNVMGQRLERTSNVWDDALFQAARRPVSFLILILGLVWAVQISDSYLESELFSPQNLELVRKLSFIVLITTFLVKFISLVEARVLDKLKAGQSSDQTQLDPTTLHALAKLIRLAIVISSVLVALPTIGIEITALLAFGGVGGIAIGFAAQDLLSNFFGGLMIYLDRPFAIGDWVRSPDREIEGTVETIGWRLTVVRTFDKRPLYIPNAVFNTIVVENPSRMTNRRINEKIGIRYKDSNKMSTIVRDVKTMLENHEDIDATQTLIVNFNGYGASSLDFFFYTFTKTTNWIRFHEVKEDVMLKIVDIVHKNGADFAFPTTTLDGLSQNLLQNMMKEVNKQSKSGGDQMLPES